MCVFVCVHLMVVRSCAVVMSPPMMPKLSQMTLARGHKQLLVQEALLTILSGCHASFGSFHHKHGSSRRVRDDDLCLHSSRGPSPLHGGEDTSWLHWSLAPVLPHLIMAGSCHWKTEIVFLLMTDFLFSVVIIPGNLLWVESYLNM